MNTSSRKKCTGYVEFTEKMKNSCRNVIEKSEGLKRHGRPRRRRKNIVKRDLKGI
jgi:hypothetical protein